MHLFIFDFDETLTFMHTCPNPKRIGRSVFEAALHREVTDGDKSREKFIRENMKPGVAKMFRGIWEKGHAVSIATFNTDEDLVLEHLRAIELDEMEIARVIIRYRPENYEELRRQEQETEEILVHKNGQVSSILEELERKNIEGTTFIDDSSTNTEMITELLPDATVIYVDRRSDEHKCDFIDKINDIVTTLDPAQYSDMERISAIIFQKAQEQADRLDKWYKINGKQKARFIRNAVETDIISIQSLKRDDRLTSEALKEVLNANESPDKMTLMQALGYHRFFSFKKNDRSSAEALSEFKTQQRFIR